jgi:sulfur carrier protein ThiS
LIKRKLAGKIPQEVDAAGLTVREFLAQLPIKPELVAFVVVNGRLVRRDHRLSDGDVVKLVPAVGGG